MEWKTVKLGDVCDFQEGYVNPPQSVPEYFDGSIKWLRATDLNDGYVYKTSRTITERGFHSAKKSAILFKPGTIAISKSGTIGRLGILQDYMCGNRAIINIIPKEDVDTYYIFSLLRSYQHYFPIMAVGSVQKNLYISILETLELTLPPLAEQKRIAAILSSLDDKIENNNRINRNLEAQAQALFKSWFVDFEPFGGTMPEDWKEGTLGEIAEFKRGKGILGKDARPGNVPVVAGGMEPAYYHDTANTKAPVITISASGANAGYVRLYNEDIWASDCSWIDASSKNLLWVYCYLSINRHILRHAQTGAVQPHVKAKDVNAFEIIIPAQKVIEDFIEVVKPLFDQIANNQKESQRLATLRDALLPKLMKGEIAL